MGCGGCGCQSQGSALGWHARPCRAPAPAHTPAAPCASSAATACGATRVPRLARYVRPIRTTDTYARNTYGTPRGWYAYLGTYRACGPWGRAALLPRVRTVPERTNGLRVPAQLHRDLLIGQGGRVQPVLAAGEVVLPIDLHPLGLGPDDVRRLGLGLLEAELLRAALEDAFEVHVVALLCRLEGRPESAGRGLVVAGESQQLLARRAQIARRHGVGWPTARWADRGGARLGGQAPATRPGYDMASGGNTWRGRRCGRRLRRHGTGVAGSRLVRWAWSAHRETGQHDATPPFLAAVSQ